MTNTKMRAARFLAALFVGLVWAGSAWATCGDGASTCFWVGGTGNMDFATDATHWSNVTGVTASNCGAGSSPCEPVAGDSITCDANSGGGGAGTITGTANTPALNVVTWGACSVGTIDFSANNNNLTAKVLSLTGSTTRTIKMGSGTWTINGTTGTVVDCTTTTNLTLTPGTSNLLVSSTPTALRNIAGCGTAKPFNTLTIASGASQFPVSVTANLAAQTVVFTAPLSINVVSANTLQSNGAPTWNGSSSNQIYLFAATAGTAATVHLGAATTASWMAIKDITFNTSSFTCTTCFDLKNNTLSGGGAINAPVLGAVTVQGVF